MSAIISLTNIHYKTERNVELFDGLTLHFTGLKTGLVGKNGSGKSSLLRLISRDLMPTSGQLTVVGSHALMRQDYARDGGSTIADIFGLRRELTLINRAVQGHATLDELSLIDWSVPSKIEAALSAFDLTCDADTPLAKLSGGQLSRAALAALFFSNADFLLLDEPSNNLDRQARDSLLRSIHAWKKGLIVASHDRELLNAMDEIIEITPLGVKRYGGNFDDYKAQKDIHQNALRAELANAQINHESALEKRQKALEQKKRKDNKGAKSRLDSNAKLELNAAKARAESSDRRSATMRDLRIAESEKKLEETREKVEIEIPTSVVIACANLPLTKKVLSINSLHFNYENKAPVLRELNLNIIGPERIHIVGANGTGKTTLIKLILGELEPSSGSIQTHVPYSILRQGGLVLGDGLTLCDIVLRENPTATLHDAYVALARFRFRADEARRPANQLSGGEVIRLSLAASFCRQPAPQLLLLDEPTNHLDLEAIEALEKALESYDGALVIVSHDQHFVERVAITRQVNLNHFG